MKIIFIRHGQSTNNVIEHSPNMTWLLYDQLRDSDPSLSKKGRDQLDVVGQYVKENKIIVNKIYCSPLKRAIESALILQKHLNSQVILHSEIYEIGGLYKKDVPFCGENRESFEKNYPGIIIPEEINEKGWFFLGKRELEEESLLRAYRFKKFLEDLTEKNKNMDETIIFIAHGDFFDKVIRILNDVKDESDFYFKLSNGSLTIFETDENNKLLMKCFNITNFFDEDLIKDL